MSAIGHCLIIFSYLLSLASYGAYADVWLPRLVGEVLQRDTEIRIWGWAGPQEKVTVKFIRQKETTTADDTGYWEVRLSPVAVGGTYDMTAKGNNPIELEYIPRGGHMGVLRAAKCGVNDQKCQ